MDSKRQNKVSRLILKDVSDILQADYKNAFGPVLITVTKVRVTSDLGLARINISVYGASDKEAVLKAVKSHGSDIRQKFALRARNQLRIMPVFEFFIDDSLDYIEKIDKLLKGGEQN